MINDQFYILALAEIVNITTILILISIKRRNPIREFKFLIFAIIFIFVGYFFYLVNIFNSSPSYFDESTLIFVRLGYLSTIIGIFTMSYSILFIDFKPNHSFLYTMTILTATSFTSGIYNSVTLRAFVLNNTVEFNYTTLGSILIVLFYMVNAYIWISRIKEIFKFGEVPFLFPFGFFCILTVLTYLLNIFLIKLGSNFTDVLASILMLVFSIAIFIDDTFPFLTNLRLDAVIIYENATSVKLYSKLYNKVFNEDESQLIGSLFSTLDKAVGQTIKSTKRLNQLFFDDKVVLISPGNYITSILLVSNNNFVSKAISVQITNSFEKKFHQTLKKHFLEKIFSYRTNDFNNFDQEMNYYKKYFPR